MKKGGDIYFPFGSFTPWTTYMQNYFYVITLTIFMTRSSVYVLNYVISGILFYKQNSKKKFNFQLQALADETLQNSPQM